MGRTRRVLLLEAVKIAHHETFEISASAQKKPFRLTDGNASQNASADNINDNRELYVPRTFAATKLQSVRGQSKSQIPTRR